MRLLFRLIIITIFGFSQTINEQLKELETASPNRRVELMNHIKEQLILMNQQDRMQTINKLRAKTQHSNQIKEQQTEINYAEQNHILMQDTNHEVRSYQEHIEDVVIHNHLENHIKEQTTQPPIQNNHQIEQPITQPTIENNQPIIETTVENNQPQQPIIVPTIESNHQISQPTTQPTQPTIENTQQQVQIPQPPTENSHQVETTSQPIQPTTQLNNSRGR